MVRLLLHHNTFLIEKISIFLSKGCQEFTLRKKKIHVKMHNIIDQLFVHQASAFSHKLL